MVRQELVEGIRQAVNKGESLKDAMMSFLNSGTPKEDIEDAARIVQSEGANGYIPPKVEPKLELKVPTTAPKEVVSVDYIEQASAPESVPSAPVIPQKVSDYSSNEKSSVGSGKKMFLIVLFFLLALIGVSIAALLLFKDKIIPAA